MSAARTSMYRAAVSDDVDAVAETAGGDVRDDRLQRLVLVSEVAPAVDDQEDVAPRLVGQFARRAARRR